MPMTAMQRKLALIEAGKKQSDIAKALEVSEAQVSAVVRGVHRSTRVEAAVAAALDKPVSEVFEAAEATAAA